MCKKLHDENDQFKLMSAKNELALKYWRLTAKRNTEEKGFKLLIAFAKHEIYRHFALRCGL